MIWRGPARRSSCKAAQVTVHSPPSFQRKLESAPSMVERAGDSSFRRNDGRRKSPSRPASPRAPISARLARDIARALDTVGHVTMLRRTKAGPFTLEAGDFAGQIGRSSLRRRSLEQHLLPLTAGLDDIPALPVTPDQAGALRQGRKLIGIAAQPGLHLATDRDVPVALVELGEGRASRGARLQPVSFERS